MDLCLECKACKSECPANVDMAKLKYEFLYHYYRANGLPLRNRLFGHIGKLSWLGARLHPLSNWMSRLAPNRWLMERVLGIDRRRPLPAFARETFTDWFDRHRAPAAAPRGRVVLFHDTFVTYNTPDVGRAAVELLEAGGYRVELADRKCCGRPMISKGLLEQARAHAEWNVARLLPLVEQGVAVVGLEPSCLLTLRDEYVDLLRTPAAKTVARSTFLLEEFLLRERAQGLTFPWRPSPAGAERRALLHGHCHQKSAVGTAPTVAALTWAGYAVTEVDSGCCGMAGSFGFEKEHYDVSIDLGERRLAPAVRAAAADTTVVAPGISCRQQIDHLTGRRALHTAEALRAQLA
jgi:Fe-S oxidoreductase